VRELEPWIVSNSEEPRAALTAALAVDDAASATLLLNQVRTAQLRAETAPQIAAIADKYAIAWASKIVGVWGGRGENSFSFSRTDNRSAARPGRRRSLRPRTRRSRCPHREP
jgi:hypothetical protein